MHNMDTESFKKEQQIFIHIQGIFKLWNRDTIGVGATQTMYEVSVPVPYQRVFNCVMDSDSIGSVDSDPGRQKWPLKK
jgi:hypothetical protein